MATTVRNIIKGSLRLINAVQPTEEPEAEEYSDALIIFNDMLDSWDAEQLALPYTASTAYATVAGQKVYSIGPGGNWDGLRPVRIVNAIFRVGSLDLPMNILSYDQYAGIPVKDTPSSQSLALYYEAQYPLGYITLYPVPTTVAQVVLSYWAQFSSVTLDTDVDTLPPGYRLAMRYCLALLLAPEYGKTPSEEVKDGARELKGKIKSANLQSPDAKFDIAIPGVMDARRRWNWRYG